MLTEKERRRIRTFSIGKERKRVRSFQIIPGEILSIQLIKKT